jgi:hypothetical protein
MIYWVLALWLSTGGNAPVVYPILFTTKTECLSFGKQLNDITKIDRRLSCSEVIVGQTVTIPQM